MLGEAAVGPQQNEVCFPFATGLAGGFGLQQPQPKVRPGKSDKAADL